MHESLLALILAAGLITVSHIAIIRPLFSSPLSKLPSAHWSAPFSSLWILSARKWGKENRLLHEAHNRLGSVVRIGPNDVSIDGADAVRVVYQGGFEKDTWYSVFDNYGVPCMFSARNSQDHSARKRMISNVYSKSSIQSANAAKAQTKVIIHERLLPLLKASSAPALHPSGIDVHSLFLATTMDFIAAYVFGLDNATNFIQNKGYRDHWLEMYNARNDYHFWPQELPSLTGLCKKFGLWLYPAWVDDANAELAEWNVGLCKKTISQTNNTTESIGTSDEPVVYNALNKCIEKEIRTKGQESLLYSTVIEQRELSVQSELFDHTLAGQETAGITLTYLTWHMSQDTDLQLRLRKELLTLSPNFKMKTKELPDAKHVDSLPLLHAIVMETLRLHAPLPGPQARRTPYPSCKINGFEIPGGVRIAALAYTLHRDDSVFPRSLEWNYKRWLPSEATEEALRMRQRQFWAFSSGGRMCIGSHFAMNGTHPHLLLVRLTRLTGLPELKNIVAAIYTNFSTYIVNDEGMQQTDGYSSRPVSERLVLRFEPAKPKQLFTIYKTVKTPPLNI